MAKPIGIVACSAEGAALCYRTICAEAAPLMGEHNHPEISMHTFPLAEYMRCIERDDWPGCGELMVASARKLAGCGAEFAICPDNTIHEAFAYVQSHSPIPWLHIAASVGAQARAIGAATLGILGTKYLMTGPVYPETLQTMGINYEIPEEEDRERINGIIFSRLVYGIITEEDRRYFNDVIERLKRRGCQAVVLGCTEIPLLVNPADCPLPTLDSTRLLARAALQYALG
jgi:aspartate racemase